MKAQAEIDQVLAKYGSWTYQTLKDLMYLDQVIQGIVLLKLLFLTYL